MPAVTLYIPCYNAAVYLPRVIPAVMSQSHAIAEVLIIDDGSTDGTLEAAKKLADTSGYPLRIIALPCNRGLAHARNRAVNEARTEFVASLDSDCVPERNWLEALMQHFRKASVAGVGGKLVESAVHSRADLWRAAHMNQDWGDSRILNPRFLFGHGTVFRSAAIREIGGYDERNRTNGEDIQISEALRRRGYNLIYEPRAVLSHLKTDTVSSLLNAEFRYGQVRLLSSGYNLPVRIVWHLANAAMRLSRDVLRYRWDIIPISLLYPFWMAYREIRSARKTQGL